MKNPLKLMSLITLLTVCLTAPLVVITFITSCKKDFDKDNDGTPANPPGSTPDAYVLKEPYIIYTNDPTLMWVAVHTTHQITGGDNNVKIQWKYDYESDYHGYYEMSQHKFEIPYEYGEDHEDYYVWIMEYPYGHFNPGSKIDYEVKVTYNGGSDTKKYTGWFYTNDPNATALTFYAISDTQEDGEEYDCNDKTVGGGPEYFLHVMNSMADDMDKDYENRYRLILHCGDFNFHGPR